MDIGRVGYQMKPKHLTINNFFCLSKGRVDHINKLAGIQRSKLPEREMALARCEKQNVKMFLRIKNKVFSS